MGNTVLHMAVNAVWIGAIFRGLTAAPGARLYARRILAQASKAEMMPIENATDALKAQAKKQN